MSASTIYMKLYLHIQKKKDLQSSCVKLYTHTIIPWIPGQKKKRLTLYQYKLD